MTSARSRISALERSPPTRWAPAPRSALCRSARRASQSARDPVGRSSFWRHQLGQRRAVLEHAVVVDGDGHEVERAPEALVALDAGQVVEQAELRGTKRPIAAEAALDEHALRDTVARDELDVA